MTGADRRAVTVDEESVSHLVTVTVTINSLVSEFLQFVSIPVLQRLQFYYNINIFDLIKYDSILVILSALKQILILTNLE